MPLTTVYSATGAVVRGRTPTIRQTVGCFLLRMWMFKWFSLPTSCTGRFLALEGGPHYLRAGRNLPQHHKGLRRNMCVQGKIRKTHVFESCVVQDAWPIPTPRYHAQLLASMDHGGHASFYLNHKLPAMLSLLSMLTTFCSFSFRMGKKDKA